MKKSKASKKKAPSLKNEKSKPNFWNRHPLIIPFVTFIALFFTGLVLFVMVGATTQGPSDARIVNIFVDGEQRTVTTRAKNVGDLLSRLEISLAKEDIVEPKQDSPIIEDDTQINIYRARPVEIIDGDRVRTILTAQRAPRLVVADLGITLLPEDEAVFSRENTDILDTGASEQLVIDRSVPVQLNIYGVIKQFRTTADTVSELLDEESVVPSPDETVQPAVTTPIKSGILVSVNRPGVKTVAKTESIDFDVEEKDDDTINAGERKIKQRGVKGERAVVYEIKVVNGKEITKKLQVITTKKPITEIVLRGTKIQQPYFDPTTSVSADKIALMSAAGIAASDYAYVDYIVSHESNWRPGALNSYTGAYGLCQSLPASKMATAGGDYLTNPVTQLKWCSGYSSRYGGWAGAYSAWLAQGWW